MRRPKPQTDWVLFWVLVLASLFLFAAPAFAAEDFDSAGPDYYSASVGTMPAAPYSIVFWIGNDSFAVNQWVISSNEAANDTTHWVGVGVRSGRVIRYTVNGTGTFQQDTTDTLTDSAWHHIACVTAAANDHSIYVDAGTPATNATSAIPNAQDTFAIGTLIRATPLGHWDGFLSHVVIYSVALTAAEVASLAGGASPWQIHGDKIRAYYPLDGISNGHDLAGSYDLSKTGTPVGTDELGLIRGPGPRYSLAPPAWRWDRAVRRRRAA